MKDTITQEAVTQYELLCPLLSGIYGELQELSKKKPDTPLNNFKVKSINRVLEPIKELLKEENMYPFLDVLDMDDMPTNSDVVLILSQYIKSMDIFHDKYYGYNSRSGQYEGVQNNRRSSLSFELPLSFEQAAAYRKVNGQYVRKNQWRDTTVRVLIDLD